MPRPLPLPRLQALALLALLVAPAPGSTAEPPPTGPREAISFMMSGAPRVSRGERSEIAFAMQIAPGYAVLSSQLEEAGLQAASVKLQSVNNISVGAARFPKARLFRVGEKRLAAYQGELRVRIPVVVSPNSRPGLRELRGKLVYQVCGVTECFAPVRQDLALRLEIVP